MIPRRIPAVALLAAALLVSAGLLRADDAISIRVHADHVIAHVSRLLTGACIEDVNHEIYGGIYSQMIFGESFQEPPAAVAKSDANTRSVSGMWRPFARGAASGRYALVKDHPFVGTQSQQMTLEAGDGEIGIENQGLNRWGLSFVAGKPYEGCVWARAEKPTTLIAAIESRDGLHQYAAQSLHVASREWQRLELALIPSASDPTGRFALKLKTPGSATIGFVFLQLGDWGRFKGLPVRRDVAQGLIDQGITVLRYGGSMVNHPGYRWKNMIGPRDRRPPYAGTWYRYSSNGWGIADFMAFSEAAGFEYVPDFNIDETPQDMADFIDYAKAAPDSEWGRRRAADGHPAPFALRYIELGNEERVDDKYAEKFEKLAAAIWAKDPHVILVVGDFAYDKPIRDPFKFDGAASRITSMSGQQRILRFAKQHDRDVWFDLHVWTDQPQTSNPSLDGVFSFEDALDKIADGAKHKIVVFEYNSGNHAVKRALANALATNAIERDGRIPIVCSANCLQPDKQNDNGWDQGLLFLNPSQVWLQPPGYLTQMLSANYMPELVECDISAAEARLDANAKRSADGKMLALSVVNWGDKEAVAQLTIAGFESIHSTAKITELCGPLEAVNTAANPDAIRPRQADWKHGLKSKRTSYTFPAHSITVIRFE